jgi:glycosyltransferase involved in cell wall biosynthesis
MDYPPNVEAARRLIERLMPRVLAAEPEARLHIVGRAPVPELRALHGINGARVWGEVPDVRPFLAAASLVAAPLTIARGVQNKVLEAMAMARPVVLTQAAATGIPGEDGTHFALADSDDAFVTRTLELLASDEAAWRMGAAARRLVRERMSWPAMLAGLPALVGREGKKARRDAA